MSEIIEPPAPGQVPAGKNAQAPAQTPTSQPRRAPSSPPALGAGNPSAPAIYQIPRELLSAPDTWPAHFKRAAALGFSFVLLAAPFAAWADPAAPRAAALPLDYDVLDDEFGGGEALPALAAAAQAAADAGLRLLLDLAPLTVAAGAGMLDAHPDWFVAVPGGAAFRFLSANDSTVDWWDSRLAAWQAAGIAGFRCLDATAIAPHVTARLIADAKARAPGTLFIAWTVGAPAASVAGLRGAGFDFTVSSSCWWDFSSPWLNEETASLQNVAPVIALAAPPGTTGGSPLQMRRALRLAATFAPGWLLEAGFAPTPDDTIAEEVRALNALRRQHAPLVAPAAARQLSSPGAAIAVLRRGPASDGFTLAVNPALDRPARMQAAAVMPALGLTLLHRLNGSPPLTPDSAIALNPGELAMYTAPAPVPVFLPVAPALDAAAARIAIEAITPQVDDGSFPVRRILGERVTVEADLIADGHDKLAADLIFRALDEAEFRSVPMRPLGNDRWTASFPLERLGRHVFSITAWRDDHASFVDEVTKKHAAGLNLNLELREGLALIQQATATPRLTALQDQLATADDETRRETLTSPEMIELMRANGPRKFSTTSHHILLDAEREAAGFSAWYEIFPRSQSGDPSRHGTFRDVMGALPRIAGMGFDVLYFPPIHPIGRSHRKGRNNSLTPAPDDPGSPYAIGSEAGGHDAIHPELGGLEDFHALRDAAAAHGIELALDFAIQCAPDHPWLTQHPDWFDWRPDGSLRCAENPPKKYEDIVNVDFYAAGAVPSLWLALRDVVQFWVDQGVRLFRVDNPHTKPLPFWHWLIADIRSRHPDTLFLAEAFTRPKVMYRLAKIGFSQSYTYFTWRNTKAELTDYVTELATTAPRDFFRPHFFVNTPDINPVFLQNSGRPGFLIRAALAATLSGLWGVYNGFELCEATPAIPGKEDYLDSEKYQLRAWDYDRPGNIVAEITALNRIRRANAALHSHLNIEFLPTNNDQVLCFRKFAADGNTIIAAISLDPTRLQTATIELPLWRFGLADDAALDAHDLMRDFKFTWRGKYQTVALNPQELPFCIWRVAPPPANEAN
jgi:starch synthase (maltosyl-transferring)